MSLFSKLLNLHSSPKPTEDFFTEVFAYVLDTETGILDKWLKSINIIDPDDNLIGSPPVLTQIEYPALEHHAQANRPDVKIALSTNKNENIVIFIESKIGSQEGNEQLKGYAEILGKISCVKRKHLIYITRDYVNSNDLSIKKLPLDTVEFSCLRWQGFYGFLKQQPETQIVREVLQFIERQRMNMSNQFLATDLVAMMNFYRSQKLMEACLGGAVEERFKKEFGQISRSSAASSEFQNHGRFIRDKNNKSSGRRCWPGIGFFDMHSSEQTEHPSLGVFLQVDPGCESRDRILNQMIEITSDKSSGWVTVPHITLAERSRSQISRKSPLRLRSGDGYSGWQGFDLSNPSGYPNISYKKSLQAFLSQEDQVASLQEFFGACIEECLRLKKNYPGLLWD